MSNKKLQISVLGDPILRKKCRRVDSISKFVLDFVDSLWGVLERYNGAGLAAPQLGKDKRIIVVDTGNKGERVCLINPEIVWSSEDKTLNEEGCLSIPKISRNILRPREVEVVGINENGKELRIRADGIFSKALQHEIDHLDGRMIIDYLDIEERLSILNHFRINEYNIEHNILMMAAYLQKRKEESL